MSNSSSAAARPASTTFFYAPPESFADEQVSLDGAEAHHLHRVLRLRTGDEIDVVDGVGGWYRVRLVDVNGDRATGTVIDRSLGVGEPLVDLRLGLALLKSRARLEFAIEKAVELGVNGVHLLDCRHCETRRADTERLRRLAAAAMKQSRRSVLTRIEGPVPLKEFLDDEKTTCGWLLDSLPTAVPVMEVLRGEAPEEAVVIVGPEGGFSEEEVETAFANGYTSVSLGARRLRAETAAVVACSAVSMWAAGKKMT